MSGKIAGFLLFVSILAIAYSGSAQQSNKLYRIGYLSLRSGIEAREEAFRKGLRELGYIEGQNVVIEWRFAKGEIDHLRELAAELVGLKVDVMVTRGTFATQVAKQATSTIPIVIGNVTDAVQQGFVASLAKPGGNITGFSTLSPDLSGKRLEMLKEAFPKISRVAFFWNSANLGTAAQFRGAEVAARTLGIQLQSMELRSPYDFESAFRGALDSRAEALIVSTAGFHTHRERLVSLELKHRLPVMYTDQLFVLAGGLMSYSTDYPEELRRVAFYVDKILKGTNPANLPVQRPTKFELVINLKTAKQIGVTIPPAVLMEADKVIK
jgi:putative ABC transport system substrate-binding protein